MPFRKYTDDQIRKALELRLKGLSYGQIEMRTGMKASAVAWYCLFERVELPNGDIAAPRPALPMRYTRNGNIVRRFTAEEDIVVMRMTIEGKSAGSIARHLNRPRTSVKGRIATLARKSSRMTDKGAA